MWISVKNEILEMWVLSKMEILEMWICQIMTFPRVNSVFSFIFSEIPEVLLLKILFFPPFLVKFQRGFFAQNSVFLFIPSEIPEVLLLKIQVVQEI